MLYFFKKQKTEGRREEGIRRKVQTAKLIIVSLNA